VDESWLSVSQAAGILGLSAQRVRSLLDSNVLVGRKVGRFWLVDPREVQRRASLGSQPGRPLSAINAWRSLILLDDHAQASVGVEGAGPSVVAPELVVPFPLDPVDRSRLRALFRTLPEPTVFERLVQSRAALRRVRVHPGVLDRAVSDAAVSRGGGHAVAALGGGVAAGGAHRVYVPSDGVEAYLGRYRIVDDVEGNLELAVIPPSVDADLRPRPGSFVPLPVAWSDLLNDPDSRARSAARDWVERLPRPLLIADGRRR
jgi:hypothetical protein